MMRALKAQDWGAGAVLNQHDAARKAGVLPDLDTADLSQPILTLSRAVPLDWTDYNGHMNEAKYLEAFAAATDRFMEIIGCDAEYIASGGSYFTAENHIKYVEETHAGSRIDVRTQMLLGEGKKLHVFHSMYQGEKLLATGESFLLHVSLETRRPSPPSAQIEAAMARIAAAQAHLPYPENAGAAIRKPS